MPIYAGFSAIGKKGTARVIVPLAEYSPLCSDATPSCSRPLHLRCACLRSRTPASVCTVGVLFLSFMSYALPYNKGKATGDFPFCLVILFLNYSTTICILPSSSCVTVPPFISPFSDLRINTLLSAIPISLELYPVKRVPSGM